MDGCEALRSIGKVFLGSKSQEEERYKAGGRKSCEVCHWCHCWEQWSLYLTEAPWEPHGIPPSMGRRLNSYLLSLANPPHPTTPRGWRFTWPFLLSRVVLVWIASEAHEKALEQDTPKGCKHAGEHWSGYVWARSELFSTGVFEFVKWADGVLWQNWPGHRGTFTKWSYLHLKVSIAENLGCPLKIEYLTTLFLRALDHYSRFLMGHLNFAWLQTLHKLPFPTCSCSFTSRFSFR